MQNKNRILRIAIPIMIILCGLTIYEYGYRGAQSELRDLKEVFSAKAKVLAKYKALIAQKPGLEEKLIALKEARKAESTKTIEGQTPSIAAAGLQDMVKSLLTARGGTIVSERAERHDEAGKFRVISVTIDMILPDTRALADILYAIETQSPYLVIRELDTRIRTFKDPRELTVKLKISALTEGK